MNHIIHDVDRDGWGSAALVIATKSPANCRIHPMLGKDVASVLTGLPARAGDTIWVLDLPWDTRVCAVPIAAGVELLWVDHHAQDMPSTMPPNVRLVLPRTSKPTTTMSMLLSSSLVTTAAAMEFVRSLCRPDASCAWGLVFDALRAAAPNWPIRPDVLVPLLGEGPLGRPVPKELQGLVSAAQGQRALVDQVLDQADWQVNADLAVVHIQDAHRIPLAQYCLAARQRHPARLIAIVHRCSTLYCGRDSRKAGVNLLQHFRQRGLAPKGHPYVCFVQLGKEQMTDELAALRSTLESN